MKSHFDGNSYPKSSKLWLSISQRKPDIWGYHEIKTKEGIVTLYTGAGPVSGPGVVNYVFPQIKSNDKVLILSGSHGDPYGRTGTELKCLIEEDFLLEDAKAIAINSKTLKASAVNILDIDNFTTKEIDDAYLSGMIDGDDRQFNVVIAAFCFSELRYNALNDLNPQDITFKTIE
ncbi:TPA: hypothetical protein ACIPAK_003698 [Salmonella enterica subsp. enterica serovar Aberdeen]